jgi:acetyltransferase-like isoleucine patch superfamily enzyme
LNGVVLEHDWFPGTIPANVSIGSGSWLWSSYAFLHYRSQRRTGVKVGDHSGIYETTFFGIGPEGEVEIGDYCTIVGVTFCVNGRVSIGNHVFMSKPVTVADDPYAVPFRKGGAVAPVKGRSVIEIGDNSWIGASVVLLPGARVGEGGIVGAATVVDAEVEPYSIVAGNPMRVVGHAPPGSRAGTRG